MKVHDHALSLAFNHQARMERQGIVYDTEEAKREILLAIYRTNPYSPETYFRIIQWSIGLMFFINETVFQSSYNNKTIIKAISELCFDGYLRDAGTRNDVFALTEKGFACAEYYTKIAN